MVTGRPPFMESSLPATMAAILRLDPPQLPPHVSPVISNVVRRCLNKEPTSRFQSARDIVRALDDPETANVAVRSASSDSVNRTETGAWSTLQYSVLRHYWPADPPSMKEATAYANRSKLEVLVGAALGDVTGKTVIDFGCGFGLETVDLVRRGAARVVGVDVDPDALAIARHTAAAAGFADKIELMPVANGAADVVVSLDSFEHFSDPASILDTMCSLLKPGGALVVSFGPNWFHPWGGHIFSVFPWAHLLFSEAALLRWRDDLRPQQPRTSFLDAGLNRMTIKRFERLIDAGPFTIEFFEAVPIRRLRRFHNRVTREFFTSIVRCRLRRSN
jgi:SAM-dependent methyltransferase